MYSIDEIRQDFESGPLERALFRLRLFSLENDMKFPFRWATSELYGYSEVPEEEDDGLPWWRNCTVMWIDHTQEIAGRDYDPDRNQAWVYFGIKDIERQDKSKLPRGEFKIPPPSGQEDSIQFGMVEIQELYDPIREAGLHMLLDVERLLRERTTEDHEKEMFSLGNARQEVLGFKHFVERQAYKDIFVDGYAQESIGRSLLQAYLRGRSYREVPVRGGRTDILLFSKGVRCLYETKVWRGPEYYEQGLRGIEEYILGEDDDSDLAGVFYLLFDPSKTQSARNYLGDHLITVKVANRDVDVVVIDLVLPQPSRKES